MLKNARENQTDSTKKHGNRPQMTRTKRKNVRKNEGHAQSEEKQEQPGKEEGRPMNQCHGNVKNNCAKNHYTDRADRKNLPEVVRKSGDKKKSGNNQNYACGKQNIQHRNCNFFHIKLQNVKQKRK